MTAAPLTAVPLPAVPLSALPLAVGSDAAAPLRDPVPAIDRPSLRLVPTGPAVRTAAPRSAVRLTRRGRAAVTAVVTCAVVACAVLVMHAIAPSPSGPTRVVVQSGQTLSQVAHQALPALPVGEAVTRLQLANSLNSLQVEAGQQLVIPR